MDNVQKLVKDYLDYLEIEKSRSPLTRASYERCLRKFINFSKAKTVNDITEEGVREFRLYLSKLPEMQKSTQAYHIIVIRNFLKYLIKRDFKTVSPDKVELPKTPERQISIMSYGDLERFMNAPKGSDLRTLRDKAILETFFSTGLRISELCKLNRDVNLERGEITVRGKGEKLRTIFFSESARKAIKDYLAKRGDVEQALFLSLTKSSKPKVIGRIIPRAIQRLVSFYARAAGIPQKVTPHQLRHQFATDLLMNGADIRSVQELLGHANITTTQVYTHVTNKELKEVHQAFHARRRK